MSFNPDQQRAPSGSAAGGQWTAGGTSSSSKSPTKAAPAKKPTPAKKSAVPKTPKLGPARNAVAAKIQQDKQAQQLYQDMLGKSPADQGAYVRSLPPDQLEKLTAILYSSPTSDPNIVKARIVVANEMGKRGLDIKKYGALGGGTSTPGRAVSPAQHVAVATGRARSAAKPAPSAPAMPAPAPRLPTSGFKNRAL